MIFPLRADIAVVPAQLNRRAKGSHRPTLADLRESGAIERDSDVVMLLSRGYHTAVAKPDNPTAWSSLTSPRIGTAEPAPSSCYGGLNYSRIG